MAASVLTGMSVPTEPSSDIPVANRNAETHPASGSLRLAPARPRVYISAWLE